MGDNRKSVALGEIQEDAGDKGPSISDSVKEEVNKGQGDLAKSVKDYFQARKDGLRDKFTAEHLPPKPEFFNSEAIEAQQKLPSNDRGVVHLDEKDRVTRIEKPDGKKVDLEYDKKGDLSKVKLPDEGQWKKEDGVWSRYDKSGEKIDTLDGEISVSSDGDLALHDNTTGETQVSHADGSRTVVHKDQSQMTKDSDGKVTSITHPDGKTAKLHYDENGELNKMNLPDGGQWNKTEDGWTRTDKNGKVIDQLDGQIAVSDEGDLALMDNNGETQISHLDGSRTVQHADQSQMTTDKDGKITSLTHPDGKTAKFEYGEDGQISAMHLPDNGVWKSENGVWNRYDAGGNKIDTLEGTIQLSQKGDVVLVDSKAGTMEVSSLNGDHAKYTLE